MKVALKSAAYLVLALLAVFLFRHFRTEYNLANSLASQLPGERPETNVVESVVSTNADIVSTNAVAATNVVANATNSVAAATNPVVTPGHGGAAGTLTPAQELSRHRSAALGYMGGFVACMIVLGALVAWDVAQMFAAKSHELIYHENAGEAPAPEYEAAEQEWGKGNYLEAISQMREYLKHNPTELHASLRIAEIYEKDLGNAVAAAMELEDVLGKRLSREKWGWTAIHLANIYSGRLNKPEQALSWLTRIVEHYPETAAARKARSRLGIPEPEAAAEAPDASPEETLPPAPEEDPNLPRGFRPKK